MTDWNLHERPTDGNDEGSLVRDAQLGSRRAFEILYREHASRIYALCLRLTGNIADADDSTQNAFVRAWQKLGSFRANSSFGTWLYRIAVNESLARRRSEKKRPYLYVVESPMDSDADREIKLSELEKAIMGLPEGARQVFVLIGIYGFSHTEAGRLLGIAAGTSKAQFHRARRLLADRLERHGHARR